MLGSVTVPTKSLGLLCNKSVSLIDFGVSGPRPERIAERAKLESAILKGVMGVE